MVAAAAASSELGVDKGLGVMSNLGSNYIEFRPGYLECYIYIYLYEYMYVYPICSMSGIITNIYHQNDPNVGKYSIHEASGV